MKQPSKRARGGDQLVDLSIVSLLKYYFVIHDDQGKKYKLPKRFHRIFFTENNIAKLVVNNAVWRNPWNCCDGLLIIIQLKSNKPDFQKQSC